MIQQIETNTDGKETMLRCTGAAYAGFAASDLGIGGSRNGESA